MHIRLIGCGKMGSAMAVPLSRAHQLTFYDKHLEKSKSLAKELHGTSVQAPLENLKENHIILLAIKPQDLTDDLLGGLKESHLLATVLTGISLETYHSSFPKLPVLRMMPNLAVRFGEGITALVEDKKIMPRRQEIEKLFTPLGETPWISEDQIDIFTSLTGSGPAFIFAIVEAITDSAIAMGLSADTAYPIVRKMIKSSLASLAADKENSPSRLKWETSSPAGTTIAGFREFEKARIRSGLIETFLAAYARAKELPHLSSES